MRGWFQTAFAVTVIAGWFLVTLWMVISLAQIAANDATCLITNGQEVQCGP